MADIRTILVLEDDPANRALFGTVVDLREPAPRRSIHIQRQGERLAIHMETHRGEAKVFDATLRLELERFRDRLATDMVVPGR